MMKTLTTQEVRRGVISHYDEHGRDFGFIVADGSLDQPTIWFHLSRQVSYICDGGDLPTQITFLSVVPETGNRVIFLDEEGPRSLRAVWWAFEEEYEEALQACESRPTYRFRRRDGRIKISRLDETPIIRTLWMGKNLHKLRELYGKRYHECRNNEFLGYYFEQLDESAQWQKCDDPR